MAETILNMLAQIERKITEDKEIIEIFNNFNPQVKRMEELEFKKLGIIENTFQGKHMNYVLVMANTEYAVDAMITDGGEITFGTLFHDNSVLDTGNIGIDMEEKGKFLYKAFPGETIEKLYKYHLKKMEEPPFGEKEKVKEHLDTIEKWCVILKRTINKLIESR